VHSTQQLLSIGVGWYTHLPLRLHPLLMHLS
jgi:hypothetical protein